MPGEVGQPFNYQLAKARVRMVLNKEEYGSIFGFTSTETVVSEVIENADTHIYSHWTHPKTPSISSGDCSNATCRASEKRADAEEELAAKHEKAKTLPDIQNQQPRLCEIDKRRFEVKAELQMIKAEQDVRVAAAHAQAYKNFERDFINYDKVIKDESSFAPLDFKVKAQQNFQINLS